LFKETLLCFWLLEHSWLKFADIATKKFTKLGRELGLTSEGRLLAISIQVPERSVFDNPSLRGLKEVDNK
jgi:hypothetical protein